MSGAWVAALVGGAYLLGSVPFGLLIGLARGTDIRKAGSGNIGATNVGRVLGRPWGVLAFILDMAKGLVPMLVAGAMLGGFSDAHLGVAEYAAWVGVGAAAILGHVFPVFLKLRGGKGVATAFGVVAGLYPYLTWPAIVAGAVWLAVVRATGYVSLASLTAAALLPVCYWLAGLVLGWPLGRQWPLSLIAGAITGLVVVRHRANMRRLLAGTEPRRRPSA